MKSFFINIAFFAALSSVWPFVFLQPVTKFSAPNPNDVFTAPPDTSKKDSIGNLPFPFNDQGNTPGSNQGYESGMYLHKPSNITTNVEYDGETNEYHINENVGSFRYRTPETMSFEEYQNEDFNRAVRDYWRQRFEGENFSSRTGLVPQLLINNKIFEGVFGSNVIDIKPQGSAELIFGLNTQRTDNPQLPVKQRKVTTFDFQEKIQMNVTGQIGDKLKLSTSYNTEASFEFENKMKLAYEGKDDEIIRKIEAGNVSLPLTGSLINGSYSLFGIKTELQFGKLTVTNIFSQQKGKSQVVEVQGGAQVSEFEVYADQYEANRHFYLGQYFYDNYDKFLSNLPLINSGININRVEVWVTNKTGNYTEARNIIAFTDLGEGYDANQTLNISNPIVSPNPGYLYINQGYPSDTINSLAFIEYDIPGIRNIQQATTLLEGQGYHSGKDYEKVESMRMLNSSEYTIFPNLGYISLNSALNSDEVLAVAYEYTVGGQVFRVGEFSNTIASPSALLLKLIKGTSLTPKDTIWNLMMKNIYSIGAYQVNSEDFRLNVMYQNDKTGTAINFIPVGAINSKPLIEVLNLDRLNSQLDPYSDGQFDFIDKVTINSANGRVIFPVKEPFGRYIFNKMVENDPSQATAASQYAYFELYDSTQSKARQIAEKNKFFLKGSYKSASGSDIPLNAMNIPQGSVKVTAGGQILVENQDYTVDYTLGRVKIINQGLLQSGTPIKISLESQSLFNIQSKTLMGMHLNYQISKDFNIGGTILNLTERPLTQKVNIGDEPISNTIWGLDGTWRTESRFLTKLVDKLPFLETKAPSSLMVTGEFAHLIPGHSKAIAKSGISYIDDFEGSKSSISLGSPGAFVLASTPQGQSTLFPDETSLLSGLDIGFNRAKLAWYVVDPTVFYRESSVKPPNIEADLTNHLTREVFEKEIWPNKQQQNGIPTNISVLNLAFYPEERGPYNYDFKNIDADGKLLTPANRWGGIMRKIESNDFEAANIEFIEFWMMDPFVYDSTAMGGDLYFNLGDLSEDVLRDGRKSFENGFPTSSSVTLVDTTAWGRVPVIQSVVNAFDNSVDARPYQDVGIDGLGDADERSFFSNANQSSNYKNNYLDSLGILYGTSSVAYLNALSDPSTDNYHYYRGSDYDDQGLGILGRYKNYNGMEGNSLPTELSPEQYPTASTTQPNAEDINRDNTLSEFENYFQYRVRLNPTDMEVGKNYIVDKVAGQNKNGDVVDWYQFKVPLYSPDLIVGSIQDFKSIRFFRMFLKGFEQPVVLRFAKLDLVRGEWRKYNSSFLEDALTPTTEPSNASFDVSAVNIEENGSKTPVNYVLPPGVDRVIDPTNPQLRQLNEQAMVLKVCELADGDARAAYRNVDLDVRQYKRLEMFVHAEALPDHLLNNNDVCAFIRIGSDYQNNFYEYEIPLTLTSPGSYNNDDENDRKLVWPEANMFDFAFEIFQSVKQQRNNAMRQGGSNITLTQLFSMPDGNNRVSVVGNPNLSNIKTVMVGIRNRSKFNNNISDDGLGKCVEVWINELRLTDFDERGGWAANMRMTAKLADFGTVTLSGTTSTPGFGSIEKKVSERSKEQVLQYDVASNFELGKFLPEKIKLSVPMFIGYSEGIRNPQYNPLDPDIALKVSLKDLETKEEKDSLRKMVQDYTRRKSLNFTNVKFNSASAKATPWNISNFAVSYSFSEQYSRNINTIYNRQKMYRGALTYNYNNTPKNITPFKDSKLLNKPMLKLIKDFNFYLLPSQFSFMTDMDRSYNELQLRNVENMNYTIPASYTKDFRWNRIYDLKYDITKSLKFDFSANNIAKIDEPVMYGQRVDKDYKQEYDHWKDSTWTNISNFGRTTNYRHTFNLNYTVPVNKIPILNWLSTSIRYGGTYEWVTSPRLAGDTIQLGNTIKNSNTRQINVQANMLTLYNKIPVLQNINKKYAKGKRPQKKQKEQVQYPKEGDPPLLINFKANIPKAINHKLKTIDVTVKVTDTSGVEIKPVVKIINENRVVVTFDQNYPKATVLITGQREKVDDIITIILEQSARVLMMVKNINVSYSENAGTVLPGYMPNTQFMGMEQYNGSWAPGLGFISGFQDTAFGTNAANKNRWLTTDPYLNAAYLMNSTKTLNIRATIEPVTSMRIDVTANRTNSENISRYYKYDDIQDQFSQFGRQVTGSFSMTYNTWNTTFEKFTEDYSSKNFQNFKDYRMTIARRLAYDRIENGNAGSQGYTYDPTTETYPDGYGPTSQEVLIPAFLAAYSGRSPDRISLSPFPSITSMSPNWSINYSGLTTLKVVKKYFRTLTVAHSYRSTYSVNSFTSSLDYNDFEDGHLDGYSWTRYTLGNFVPQKEINAVSISEQFSPLISFDATMVNSIIAKVEIKRSRNLAFSLSNNQMTEMQTKEYVFGAGYRIKDLAFEISGKPFKSDLNLRSDVSIRNDFTIIRKLETATTSVNEGYDQLTAGQKMVTIKISADYQLGQNFNLRLFYDRIVRKPKISTSFDTYNTNVGISVRFTLAQ